MEEWRRPVKPPVEQLLDLINAVIEQKPEGAGQITDALDLFLLNQINDEQRAVVRATAACFVPEFKAPAITIPEPEEPEEPKRQVRQYRRLKYRQEVDAELVRTSANVIPFTAREKAGVS